LFRLSFYAPLFFTKKAPWWGFDEVFILPKYYIKPRLGLMGVMRLVNLLMADITLPLWLPVNKKPVLNYIHGR